MRSRFFRSTLPAALTAPLLTAPLLLAVAAGVAQAQYTGPGTQRPPNTLGELIANPIEGQGVQLRGRLVQQLNGTKYMFSDGSNQIRVQITNELFPRVAIDERTEIEIVGRVERDFMETPEIDVSAIDLVGAAATAIVPAWQPLPPPPKP